VTEHPVVVIGAGLTGLAVAARLVSAGREVCVLEGSGRVGGQIHSLREADTLVELGAEGFVARSRAVPALCELLGIAGSLVDQLTTDTYALEGPKLVLLPPGEAARRLGFQVPPEELGRGIRSLAQGMGELIDALVARVGAARVQLETRVVAIFQSSGELRVELGDGRSVRAPAVVLAVPARAAAALLRQQLPAPSAELQTAVLLSNVSVNLLYLAEQFRDYPPGSGLIFPESFASVGLRAVSFVDHKFAGRVAAGRRLLRVFFRPTAEMAKTFDDQRFVVEAARAIESVLTLSGKPVQSWVSRWDDALPVFSPEFQAKVAAADAALQAQGIHLAGSAFHGAGIDSAVASAERIAERLSS
jgi:oxygen-dependent protoporphyrinogen oxidase